jgi:hypothetical protein
MLGNLRGLYDWKFRFSLLLHMGHKGQRLEAILLLLTWGRADKTSENVMHSQCTSL